MISSTFGAPLGGTTDGGQYGFDSLASSLITPPNFGGSGGSCLPSIVVVALGEPGVPVTCCANAPDARDTHRRILDDRKLVILLTTPSHNGRSRGCPHGIKRGRYLSSCRRIKVRSFRGLCTFGRTKYEVCAGCRFTHVRSGQKANFRRDPGASASAPKADISRFLVHASRRDEIRLSG